MNHRWGSIGLGVLALATVVIVVVALGRQASNSRDPLSVPQPTVTISQDARPRAVFIGDSYTAGAGGDGTRWTSLVADRAGWKEINLGRGGTGYVTSLSGDMAKKGCGLDYCPSYGEMVGDVTAARPNIIVVAGGRNDGAKDVSGAALTLLSDLHKSAPDARVIVVSPLYDDDAVPSWMTSQAAAIKAATAKAGLEYFDIGQPLTGRRDLISADGIHPNAEGYRAIADAVIRKLGS